MFISWEARKGRRWEQRLGEEFTGTKWPSEYIFEEVEIRTEPSLPSNELNAKRTKRLRHCRGKGIVAHTPRWYWGTAPSGGPLLSENPEFERYEMPARRGSAGGKSAGLGAGRNTSMALWGLWISGFLIAALPHVYSQLTWTPIFVSSQSEYNIQSWNHTIVGDCYIEMENYILRDNVKGISRHSHLLGR